MTQEREVRLAVDSPGSGSLVGFAYDPARPDRRLVVEALVDGVPVAAVVANLYCEELAAEPEGDACYGFYVPLAPMLIDTAASIEVRVANRDDIPGRLLSRNSSSAAAPSLESTSAGGVEWTGGLRFTGWVRDLDGTTPPWVRVYLDREEIAGAQALGWRPVDPPQTRPRRGFDLHLPERFADGQVWRVEFRNDDGNELFGSPVTFCAFAEGLEATLARLASTPGQRLRGALLDRLMPNALPYGDYEGRRDRFRPSSELTEGSGWGVAILEGGGLAVTLDSLERQTYLSWTGAVLATTSDDYAFSPYDLYEFVVNQSPEAEWFLFLAHGVRMDEGTLARFAACAATDADADLIYPDLETADSEGQLCPLAFPAFDYERMLEQGYFATAFALPRRWAIEAAEARVDNLFRLANIAFDREPTGRRAVHLPGPMAFAPPRPSSSAVALARAAAAHLSARKMPATVVANPARHYPTCRVRRSFADPPKVSILIPTRDRPALLAACLQSIRPGAAKLDAQILVVDNESREPQTLACLAEWERQGVTVVAAPGPFNFARINNLAAERASGEFLCFLNNDILALDDSWLEEMLSRHVDPTVGAVGAKLIWPSGVVQHGGVTLGVNFHPIHAYRDRIDADPGHGGQLLAAHETGAVTAACMTTRRDVFLDSGGFDALRFSIDFNDVDYCLKLSERGLRIVLTPHAKLQHLESASRGRALAPEASARFRRELRALRDKWGEALIDDPSYSPLLALSDPPYAALAWPPRSLKPRRRSPPRARRFPPGW
jgi:GT2 family glycosyltransferase